MKSRVSKWRIARPLRRKPKGEEDSLSFHAFQSPLRLDKFGICREALIPPDEMQDFLMR